MREDKVILDQQGGAPVIQRPRIGIVDDEATMRDALVALLRENDFDPVPMAGSADFFALEAPQSLVLVLIDLKLSGESGLSLAMQIRTQYDLPIVMLTGVGGETDKIVGLEVGADDYLLKPFNPRELIARIRAVLRRYDHVGAGPVITHKPSPNSIVFGRMSVDPSLRIVQNDTGQEVPLTNAEYRLLEYFLQRPNQIVTRVELLAEIGSDLSRYMDRTIDVLILRLRRKIEENPSKPVHLQTRRGQGYIFVAELQSPMS
ncbi:response regulator transcription factor [Cochlodiniinecator piscidefendens]|uniref:response regulator transcription factor n=1 Tax=Cochlodiniinecator piscidefendens TaxID=2715756 RepID=UPI002F41EE2A